MFGDGEVSDRFANFINRYMPDLVSVEFVKANISDSGILGNIRHLIPDAMIKKACEELNFNDENKRNTYKMWGIKNN